MSDLSLTVLGCDGSFPGPGGACSSYLVRTPSTTVLVDAGTGSLANLQQHVAPETLDAIVITHQHADHCANVADMHVIYRVGPVSVEGLPVYAAPGVREAIFQEKEVAPVFEWVELEDDDDLEIGDMRLRFSRTDHQVYTIAVRIDAGERSLLYTADTGVNWSPDALAGDIDLGLFEAAFTADSESDGHLSGRQAGELARKAGVSRLLLTHIRPQFDKADVRSEAAATFGAPVEAAELGKTYDV